MDTDRLDRFLEAHDGVITSAEAAGLGLGPNDLRKLTRVGDLRRVVRGAYARPAGSATQPATGPATQPTTQSATGPATQPATDAAPQPVASSASESATDCRRAVVAVLRSQPGRLAASHQSGALLLGLPLTASALRRVHVTRRVGTAATRTHDTFTVHRCPGAPGAFGVIAGQPVVTPALAVVGTALEAGVRAGIGVADAALRAQLTTRAELSTWLGRLRHTPGVTAARFVVERASATSESIAESQARLELVALGYRVVPQFTVLDEGGRFVARVDFLLPDLGVVVEVDGRVKYAGAQGRDALAREKHREDDIRALGYGVVRLVWADLTRPGRIRSLVERARSSVARSFERTAAEVREHGRRTGAQWDGLVLHPYAPLVLMS